MLVTEAWDAKDGEFCVPIIWRELERVVEMCGEDRLLEFVYEFGLGVTCKGEYKIRRKIRAPMSRQKGDRGFRRTRLLADGSLNIPH